MNSKYKISHKAKQDIENIWLYTVKKWSMEQADRYYNLIMNEIEYLAKNPNSGNNFGNIRKGYFYSKIKSHLIFYKINKKDKKIEIIRILHQRMDIKTRLKN